MGKKWVYHFTEGNKEMKDLLGGKGANLAEMTRAGLPVPPGFTITTEACNQYYADGKRLSAELIEQVDQALERLEEMTGKSFGSSDDPLLVSVRSGSVFSMPGMMDTILNLGLNDQTVEGLARLTGNPRFAYDSYRRFIQMFSDVVLGVDSYLFEEVISDQKEKRGVKQDPDLSAEDWQEVIQKFKQIVSKEKKIDFPQDPKEQLLQAIQAVFASWNNQRAMIYRKLNKISDSLGTAVNVQLMVFGNMGSDSGTGVAFTRNPSTGENELYGEFLINAQGEDVVAGIRTPEPISQLKSIMPEVYAQFLQISQQLERHYKDLQDIEFTIERGKLYLLQTRNGKRTAQAAVKVAVQMVKEGLIDRETAIMRVDPEQLNQLLHRRVDEKAKLDILVKGLPASPGAATGKVVFDADDAESLAKKGEKVILVRPETTPEDIHGIIAAEAVVTSRGGMTSHAAVVARGMGKPCICGCDGIKIDLHKKEFRVGEVIVREGDLISIDGALGTVMLGHVPLVDPELSPEFLELLSWADQVKELGVRANADNPEDAAKARQFGAEGIGLCRTEHMFMSPDRVPIVQAMIMAETVEERQHALAQLLPMQQNDFYHIFKEMQGLPVTIRLLDPPLHEFLPNLEELIVEVDRLRRSDDPDLIQLRSKEEMLRKVRSLHELNPMLGHRGCRLGIVYPEIYAMQIEAIFNAAFALLNEGINVEPEIMIPLVGHVNELALMRELVEQTYQRVKQSYQVEINYVVGTMIEIPRAALTADQIAQHADFFSFGTNDLTQTTFGFSRDDAEGKFLHYYLDHKILPDNPFIVLDRDGVGKLIETGVNLGRSTKANLKTGICGEHGGEKNSIEFCYLTGLNYVSCSPYRVPLARLASAQASIKHRKAAN
jgi:pyruvate,orthophosphate dikinase